MTSRGELLCGLRMAAPRGRSGVGGVFTLRHLKVGRYPLSTYLANP